MVLIFCEFVSMHLGWFCRWVPLCVALCCLMWVPAVLLMFDAWGCVWGLVQLYIVSCVVLVLPCCECYGKSDVSWWCVKYLLLSVTVSHHDPLCRDLLYHDCLLLEEGVEHECQVARSCTPLQPVPEWCWSACDHMTCVGSVLKRYKQGTCLLQCLLCVPIPLAMVFLALLHKSWTTWGSGCGSGAHLSHWILQILVTCLNLCDPPVAGDWNGLGRLHLGNPHVDVCLYHFEVVVLVAMAGVAAVVSIQLGSLQFHGKFLIRMPPCGLRGSSWWDLVFHCQVSPLLMLSG